MNSLYVPRAVLFLAAALLCSCDLLRGRPFEVAAWSPGEGFHDSVPEKISLSFTLEPDRLSVERAFSLTEDGNPVTGSFFWNNSVFYFIPAAPLEKNRDYLVGLGTGAQDRQGLSLERSFDAPFTTRPQASRPFLIESVPPDGGTICGREPIRLRFSGAMKRPSPASLSFSPSCSGVWDLEEDGFCAVFTPSEPWINGRNYRLAVDASLSSSRALSLGQSFNLHFSAGSDTGGPVLLAAYALDGGVRTAQLVSGFEYAGWERYYALELVFSEPVDTASAAAALDTEPSLGIVSGSPPGFGDDLVFRFKTEPAWETPYVINLNNTVKDAAGNSSAEKTSFRIRTAGPRSKPPSLAGIRVPMNPSASSNSETLGFAPENILDDLPLESSVFPFDTPVPFWVELYFDTARNEINSASINQFSLMNRFKFGATNNALSFSPREIRTSDFSVEDPAPGRNGLFRAEIRGMITNRPYAGMITIEMGAGLEDSFGNKSAEAFRILLLK